jgi:prolyl oligopeptidase
VFIAATGFASPTALWRWTEEDGLRAWAAENAADAPALTVRQDRYRSLDGTEIGIFLIHAVDVVPGPETPAILNGYGGFAIAETPNWSPQIAAWCEAGGLFAIAGLRGGYEEGEAWHHAGRREHKQNVFDDFHAAGDWLVANGLTSRDRLGIFGGSNGGLLVGAALTQRPDAYRAVWCAVPLLDMVRFPQFLIARLWTDEYGDPDVAEEFAWLSAYSPYHHVVDGTRYPAVLMTTAEGDTRVDPLHARKMAALLQHAGADQDGRPILLHQEGRAGHGVGKPVSKRADEYADSLTFFAWQLGMERR